jgi:hypothetical protein
MLTCQYCHQSYPAPQANQPPPSYHSQQIPQIVIMHQHSSYDDSTYQMASVVNWSYWMMRAIIPCIVLLVFAGSSVAYWVAGKSKMASALVWDGTTPFDCSGNDDYSVTGVNATFNAGTAITVSGNCHFTCTDCNIKAPTGIEADGNAQVQFINGTLVGTDVMVSASGNSRVNVSGNVTATGQVKQESNAHVSAPKQAPAAPKAAPPTVAAAAAPSNPKASAAGKPPVPIPPPPVGSAGKKH